MIKIAIVEDNAAEAQALSGLIAAWCSEHGKESVDCVTYSDAVRFLEQGSLADIVFMDIEMPYMNGMDAAAEFRKCNPDAVLVFVTRVTRYAVQGYCVDAAGYLVKPVGREALFGMMEKALRLHRERVGRHMVMLKTKDGVVKVSADRIRYVEAVSHRLHVCTGDTVYKVWTGMDNMLEILPEEFVCCHRGYLVNLKYVDCVGKDGLQMIGEPDLLIPISRQRRAEFMEKLTDYYARTMRG